MAILELKSANGWIICLTVPDLAISQPELPSLKAREESYQSEVTELRSKSDYLRLELVNLTRKVDKLSEEKNGYRAQVQDMNMALKNRLVLLMVSPL